MLRPSFGSFFANGEEEIRRCLAANRLGAIIIDWDHLDPAVASAALEAGRAKNHRVPTLTITANREGLADVQVRLDEWDEVMRQPRGEQELGLRLMAHLDGMGKLLTTTSSNRNDAKLVVVTAAKGGVGTSSLAVNIAVMLRRLTSGSVILIDGDLTAGDHDVLLALPGSPSRRGVYEAMARAESIDRETLEDALADGPGGVRHLLSPVDPRLAERVAITQWREVLQAALSLAELVVVDCSEPYSDRSLTAFELADEIVLVCTPEMSSLRNTVNLLNTVSELGWDAKTRVLVNRADTAFRLSVLEGVLRKRALAAIPSMGAAMLRAINGGAPLLITTPDHPSRKYWQRAALGILDGVGWELPDTVPPDGAFNEFPLEQWKPPSPGVSHWLSRVLTKVSQVWAGTSRP
jgi:MinD-like ATPase involved in chromosome partitioning or flagellar assembly